MHGAPGGPTSSALYDAATDAFRRWRDGDESALDDLVRMMSPVLWHVVRATGLDKRGRRGRRPEHLADARALGATPCATRRPSPAGCAPPPAARRGGSSKASTRTRPVEDEVLDARMPAQTSPEAEVVTDDENALLWQALWPAAGALPEAAPDRGLGAATRLLLGRRDPRACRSAASARPAGAAWTSSGVELGGCA